MSYIDPIDPAVLESIRARLIDNKKARERRGGLVQDADRLPSEIFYGNLTQAEFDKLPLMTKRRGGPARLTRFVCEPIRGGGSRVFAPTYEKLHNDKESFEVFVNTYELKMRNIEY